jgi:hypothetical protein
MDNLIKIQAEQGSFDTSGNKNLIDIHIPANIGVINLKDSYININTKCEVTSTADAEAVFDAFLTLNGASSLNINWEDSACLIKNASAFSSTKGKIEDVKRCDVVRTNLALYEKSSDDKHFNLGKLTGGNFRQQVADSPQNELPKIGSVKGRSRDQDIFIPLKSIFGFCHTENYDTNKMGSTRIHMEANFNHLGAGILSLDWADTLQYGVATEKFGDVADVTVGADRNYVVTSRSYPDLQDSPFFVGQQIDVERTKAGTPGTTEKCRITKIEFEAESALKITFSKNWTDGAAAYTAIKLKPTVDNADRNASVNINKVELVAHVNASPDSESSLIFSSMMAQEDQFSNTATSFNRTYDMPANTKNVYLMFNNSGDAKILSESNNLTGYRLTVDNEEIVNREVKINSPLHHEQVNQVMMNNGKKVGDLRAFIKDVFNGEVAGDAGRAGANNVTPVVVMSPYPFKPVPSKLNVELNGSAALGGNIIVFSEVVKSVN